MTATELAREVKIPQPTLSKWHALSQAVMPQGGTPNDLKQLAGPVRSAGDKVRIVPAAERLSDNELGALLRR
ncbi:hypothetical protein [Sorangium atrum]|uniref:Transposase n=1 Tax=Sorangium atrum TaxID=2995308 RepID=A0ABT5BWM1_9BACT|nr:hypothetical protein [Sorangium aterium]MDC0678477.1 hypothetical protein [Sorangium aterium]